MNYALSVYLQITYYHATMHITKYKQQQNYKKASRPFTTLHDQRHASDQHSPGQQHVQERRERKVQGTYGR